MKTFLATSRIGENENEVEKTCKETPQNKAQWIVWDFIHKLLKSRNDRKGFMKASNSKIIFKYL